MSRPRPQLRRNKSSRVGDSSCHFYLITRMTPKHKKDLSVLLCIQDQSVTKHSTKLNQQNDSYCISREKLLISGDIESNSGPVAHEKSFYGTVAGSVSSQTEKIEGTRMYLRWFIMCFFSSVAHQLHCIYNDHSYHMNVHAAVVEYIRNNRQRFIGPITEQLWVCCHSNQYIV